MTTVLEVRNLNRRYGAVVAADDINLEFKRGEIVGLIGSNGAGKTTFVNMVTGWTLPSSGEILLAGTSIIGKKPREMARLGVTRSFQIPQLFTDLTVRECMALADALREDAALHLFRRLCERARGDRCGAALGRFSLTPWAERRVSELPQGIRKLLDIAMAMVREPKLLLLDEPTSGVAQEEKFAVMDRVFSGLEGSGVTVLFVEHDMEIVSRYVSRVVAFARGCIIADGSYRDVLASSAVQEHVTGRKPRPHQAEAARA